MSENTLKEDRKGYIREMWKKLYNLVVSLKNEKETAKPSSYYTIVAPGTIQPDTSYAVTITIHKSPEPVTIRIDLTGPSYHATKTVDISSLTSEIIQFDVPTIQEGTYELKAEGLNGLIFKKSSNLIYKCAKPKVYIQTDKAMYKPGDVVQYRILALDENVKPAKLVEPLNFGLRDGAYNEIKETKDIQFVKGVHMGKFQLSEQPVLGYWHIEITAGSDKTPKADKSFEVAKYVLPKFSVEIESDKQVAVLDKAFKVTVRSKYTYGKPVKGKATIKAKFDTYMDDKSPGAEKTVDVDGKGEVEFNLMDDLNLEEHAGDYDVPEIKVEAVMTEAYTGLQQSTTNNITVVRSRYNVTVLDLATEYEVNKPFEIKVLIKKLNGTLVTNAKSTAKLMLGHCSDYDYGFGYIASDLMYEAEVDQNGIATFRLKLTKPKEYSSVKVMFEETIHHHSGGFFVKTAEEISGKSRDVVTVEDIGPLRIISKQENLQLGEEFTVAIKSNQDLTNFVYTIIARGKIIKHEYVHVAEPTKCHSLKMKATFEMAPSFKIFAYFIQDGELRYDETTLAIMEKFENKLEINAPEQTKPSDVVSLSIKTDPDSLVGLLGVDQSVLLLQSGNDFDEKSIFNDLNNYESRASWDINDKSFPGRSAGFVTLTNASYPEIGNHYMSFYSLGRCRIKKRTRCARSMKCRQMRDSPAEICEDAMDDADIGEFVAVEPKIRTDFVENWIFDNIDTDSNGIANFTKKIPDTITSWVITGFSLNENTGFAMTENPTKIRVFQPFFLSTNLPYSIKRGEVITIPVVVFNYMETTLDAQITMENADDEYEFIATNGDVINESQVMKKLTVSSNNGESVSFTIKPKIIGEITLKFKAITPVAGDAMHQKLKVEPEGVTQYENEAFFISLANGEPIKHTLKTKIPTDAVLDSEYLEFCAVGDILGPTIKNIDKLVRMPYGCGEQNMINFVPNILVLRYLNAIKMHVPSIEEKAKHYMEMGYQRELTYKHRNGSYSVFGEGSSESNSWLTAYVVRSFMQARKYITIDEKIIQQALEYLIKTQNDNGQFPQTGKLFYSSNQNDVGVSAFILAALLEDEVYALKYKNQIDKSIKYLEKNIDQEEDVYSLALIAVIFQKVKHPKTQQLMERLELKSTFENNLKWWSNALEYHNNNIEVTAYILQSLIETEEAGKLLPIIKWLIKQRNSLGGFSSTQDTVVGLQALIKFAEKYAPGAEGKMVIQFQAQTEEGVELTSANFKVDKENSLLLQSHVLPKSTRQVIINAEGEGSSLVQLAYRYNLANQNDKPSFLIKHSAKEAQYPGQLLMNVSAEYKPQSGSEIKESNMAVMEISLPSGYTTDNDSLKPIRDAARVQRVETKNEATAIVVYLESLIAGQSISFDVLAEKIHAVAQLKPAPISLYDYYNAEQRATVYYEIAV